MILLSQLTYSLTWETTGNFPNGIDLDIAAFMLSPVKKIPEAQYFVFYNNRFSPSKSVFLEEDDRTGQRGETMSIDLSRVEEGIEEIILVAGVFKGKEKSIPFGHLRNAVAILKDANTGVEICRYILNTAFPNSSSMEFGRLYYRLNRWKFESLGVGYEDGFNRFLDKFAD